MKMLTPERLHHLGPAFGGTLLEDSAATLALAITLLGSNTRVEREAVPQSAQLQPSKHLRLFPSGEL